MIRLRNGDAARGVVGLVADATRPTFRFRPDEGEARDVAATELAALAFNPLLTRPRKPKGPFAHVVLTDGSRLSLVNVAIAADMVKGETTFGQKIEFPLESLVALDVLQGKAAYLSDLKPAKVEQAGFLGTAWPWAANRTVRGRSLRLTTEDGDSTFDKGIGTHPRTVLTYDLGGKYQRFEALVGLDPVSGVRGRAVVRVLVDGKEQTVSGLATLNSGKAIAVRLDVAKAKQLTLEVDFGPTGDVRADVNWGNARLVE
ncbi:MAG: NPCBM/NEW2 domain-containing protein [Gemmataceae bacterium]